MPNLNKYVMKRFRIVELPTPISTWFCLEIILGREYFKTMNYHNRYITYISSDREVVISARTLEKEIRQGAVIEVPFE